MRTPLMAFLVLATAGGAWYALYWLVTHLGPGKPFALGGFYAFLFVGVSCGAAWLAWVLASPWAPLDSPRRSALAYLGHGVLLALAACAAAWLQSHRVLTSTTAFLVVALYASMALAFVFARRGANHDREPWSPTAEEA